MLNRMTQWKVCIAGSYKVGVVGVDWCGADVCDWDWGEVG